MKKFMITCIVVKKQASFAQDLKFKVRGSLDLGMFHGKMARKHVSTRFPGDGQNRVEQFGGLF